MPSGTDEKAARALLARLKLVLERETGRSSVTVSHYLEHRLAQEAESDTPDFSPPEPQSEPGSGFFELKKVVATGGMGAILSAQDQNILRTVAVKVMHAAPDMTEDRIHRFVAEARITGQLEHPNIVPLYEMGVAADGTIFYTMRLVEGVTLSDILFDIRVGNKNAITRYPLGQLLTMFQKVCDAMAYAHSRGVAHRDLKPDNIMIGEFGEVLVMDWGLAKLLPEAAAADGSPEEETTVSGRQVRDPFHTLNGLVKGTPRYMAPEQAEGKIDQIDERTDIYSLGAILYTILTLRPPVQGDNVREVLEKVVTGEITPPTAYNLQTGNGMVPPASDDEVAYSLSHCPDRKIPAALSAVTMKAMARLQADRYQSVAELQKEIAAYQGGYATSAEHAGILTLLRLTLKRHKTEYSLVAAAFVLLLIVAGFSMAKVTNTLSELRASAPFFYAKAVKLVDELKFAKAEKEIVYALKLQPENADFHVLRGHILQSKLRLRDARDAYAEALKHSPDNPRASENLTLCNQLLAENQNSNSLTPASLSLLRVAMLNQGRKPEADYLNTKLGKSPQQVLDSWQAVMARSGIQGKLDRDSNGQLQLDLSNSDITDLSPLKGMPLVSLNLAQTQIEDISPLEGFPLVTLDLTQTQVSDLSVLSKLPLQNLVLGATLVRDLGPLKYRPLNRLDVSYTKVRDLTPLKTMPLIRLDLRGTEVSDLAVLRDMPLKMLLLEGCASVKDFSPLADCKQLELLTVPLTARGLESLRQLPKLKRLAVALPEEGWERATTPEEFWQAYDERNK